jgi:peptidoglycan/xylan/chitin deacetylase (PgdA/CDA1 family)
MRRILRPFGYRALRAPVVERIATAAAAIRGHRLVFVFHRIIEDRERSGGIVPTVPQEVFRRQLGQILDVGDIVPLASMLGETSLSARPRFALTFDDDSITHVEVVLPILRERQVEATFFVSGRSLHGLGPLWFEKLDALILTQGVSEVASWIGTPTRDAEVLAGLCENDTRLQRRLEEEDVVVPQQLGRDDIRALVDAGMTIGFHTLHHQLLTGLSDEAIDAALRDGRDELESVVEEPVLFFAYPHGKTDDRIAERVRSAGYIAAWTGRPRAIKRESDRYQLGRWETPPVVGLDFGARMAVRLNSWGKA